MLFSKLASLLRLSCSLPDSARSYPLENALSLIRNMGFSPLGRERLCLTGPF